MKMAKWIAIQASCAVLLLLVGAPTASADMITLDITNPNSALSGFTAPYATVTVALINPTASGSDLARVTFTSDTTAGTSFLMGGETAADLNINPNFTVSGTITFAATGMPGFAVPFITTYGSLGKNVDGFGIFNFEIDLFDGYTRAASEIAFTLTNTSGMWASAADVLTPNADGFLAGIHGFACANSGSGCSAGAGAITTGFAVNGPPGPPTPTPEPAGMTLIGMSLLTAYRALRRKA